MNWALRLYNYTKESPDISNNTKNQITKYCTSVILEESDMFDVLADCLQYMKENCESAEYNESKLVISEFYGKNKSAYTDELMENAYLENAHNAVMQLSELRKLNDISAYTEAYANDVIKDTLSFQYYPKVAMGEIRLTAFMDNMVELMQLYQPAKMVYGEDPDKSDTMDCCLSSYDKARKNYIQYENFPMNDIPTVQLESYARNSTFDKATSTFETLIYENKMRNYEKVVNRYDLKPFPLADVSTWKMEMESVSINNLHKNIQGFEAIPAYEVSGGVHSVGNSSEEWKTLKKAVLSYMDAGRHSDCIAVGNLDIRTEHKSVGNYLKSPKTDQNAKVDTGKLGLDEIDKGQTIIIKKYTRHSQPFFAYVQIGDVKEKASAWILYKDTIAKRHCMYYMAHALCSLNLVSPTVESWAKKQLEEFNAMKNPYDKDGKTIIAKESDDNVELNTMTKELNTLGNQLSSGNEMSKLSDNIDKQLTAGGTDNEAVHVGTMLPQVPVTEDEPSLDKTASLYVPEGDDRPDTKYIRWGDRRYSMSDMYKIDKTDDIIDAARTISVQESVKYAREILKNISKDPVERSMQKTAFREYVESINDAVDRGNTSDNLLPVNDAALDAIHFYFERCYKADDTGEYWDIFEFTTSVADNLYEENADLPFFYVNEAADVDLDMKGIVKILNEKGYNVKYSCAGHPASPKKDDRDRNNVYYGKLYSTARLVFDGKFKFQDSPKGWHFNPTTEKNDPPRTSLYVDEITYDEKKGSGNQAFLSWKNKYMSALRTWVSQIPDADKMRSREADAVAAKISDSSHGKTPEEVKKESVMTESTSRRYDWMDTILSGRNPFEM